MHLLGYHTYQTRDASEHSRSIRSISVPVLIFFVIVAALIARQFRMKWEDIVAFIVGPSMLLILINAFNRTLREDLMTGESATSVQEAMTQSTVQSSHLWLIPVSIVILLLGLIVLIAVSHSAVFSGIAQRPFLSRFANLGRGQNRAGSAGHKGANGTLYFITAVKLGAATAAADQRVLPNEQRALKRVFNLTAQTFPQADEVYHAQLTHPEPLSVILRPFLKTYGRGSAVAETLIFGMTCVAMADGHMSASELGLIRMTADALGIKPPHTVRILMSAGYVGGGADPHQRNQKKRQQHGRSNTFQASQLTERETHLATLGLSTDADAAAMRKAWRMLASRYHPDKLVSQNLPPAEMEKAEAMMQAINVAYDWLKANG